MDLSWYRLRDDDDDDYDDDDDDGHATAVPNSPLAVTSIQYTAWNIH